LYRKVRISYGQGNPLLTSVFGLSDEAYLRNKSIEQYPDKITASVDVLLSQQSEDLKQNQHENFQLVTTELKDQQTELAQMQAQYQSEMIWRLDKVNSKMDKHQSMTDEQFELIKTVAHCLKLGSRVRTSTTSSSPHSDSRDEVGDSIVTKDESSSSIDTKYRHSHHDRLAKALERLCTLASHKDKTEFRATDDEDSVQSIIEDLGQILELASSQIHFEQEQQIPIWLQKYGIETRSSDEALTKVDQRITQSRDLKRMMGMLNSARSVAVGDEGLWKDVPNAIPAANDIEASSKVSTPSRNRFMIRNHCQNFESALGTLTLFSKIHQAKGKEKADERLAKVNDDQETFFGSVTFIPNCSSPRYKIAASFLQNSLHEGSYSLAPRISFCAIIPSGSEVFRRIEHGDLNGLINLLESNLASLKDCDPEGRSLLNVRLFETTRSNQIAENL
jgi:hypothetical protein